jgi:hypothetical protein
MVISDREMSEIVITDKKIACRRPGWRIAALE